MPTIKELEAASNAVSAAYEKAQNRLARIDRILAAMTLIDDSLSDFEVLTSADRTALDKADNAQASADLSKIRKALVYEIEGLTDARIAAQRALNAAPDEAA